MSWLVPEDALAAILATGQAGVRTAVGDGTIADLVAEIYGNLTSTQQAQLVQYLTEHDIKIAHGYPLPTQTLPCWAIVIDPEELTMAYLGDGSQHVRQSDGSMRRQKSERWRSTLGVITLTENADLTRWLYHLAKWHVSQARIVVSQTFPHGQQMVGRDLEPEQIGEAGRFRFRRALSFIGEFDQTSFAPDTITNITGAGPQGTYGNNIRP